MSRARSFEPALDAGARVLLLGTLPGPASLREGQYYAHPRNAFWRLIGAVVGTDLAALPYPDRLATLRRARVGLWDVIASAVRPGSGDAAIRDAQEADLQALLARLPQLRAIGFNGAMAARIGRRRLGERPGIALVDLPSSSPAYAGMRFEAKLARWSVLGRFLGSAELVDDLALGDPE
ncbi:MAG: DNA-deoxyinosine glycosylase [Amaricoccus sp.]